MVNKRNLKLVRITTVPLSLDKLLGGQLKYMTRFFDVTIISAPDNGYLQSVGEREGTKVYPVALTRQMTPIKDLVALWRLYRFLKREKPEIVHTHTPKAGLIGMIAAKLAGVRVKLHTVAGLPLTTASGFKKRLLMNTERLTSYCADGLFPNSKGLMQIMMDYRLSPKQKLKVIGQGSSNGIDLQYFNPDSYSEAQKALWRTEWHIQQDDFVFVFVGRLVRDKGIQELVYAFDRLLKTISQDHKIKLLLVGPTESELDPLSAEVNNIIAHNPNIITTDFQQDVRPFYAISQCLVFPSHREGFPNVVLQAGAMGLPAIVTDINGCNEIIHHLQNGWIIPVANTAMLTETMKTAVENKRLRVDMHNQARKCISDHFDQKKLWNLIAQEYSKRLNHDLGLQTL